MNRYLAISSAVLLLQTSACGERVAPGETSRVVKDQVERPVDQLAEANHPARTGASLLRKMAAETARNSGVDPTLVAAVIREESDWNPRATSRAGARGLMQIMPETASEEFGLQDPRALYDPEVNLRLGVRHLRALYLRYCDLGMTLWAWHAGSGRVDPEAERITPAESRRFVGRAIRRYRGNGGGSPLIDGQQDCDHGLAGSPSEAEEGSTSGEGADRGAPKPIISTARLSRQRVRIGETADLRIEAENRGGTAESGKIEVIIDQHPDMSLGYSSDLTTTFDANAGIDLTERPASGEGDGAIVRASTETWKRYGRHHLLLRMVPKQTGRISFVYRVELDGREVEGRRVEVDVTETLGDRNP